MIVLTADQVDSRHGADLVAGVLPELRTRWGEALALGPDRTAGDEFQLLPRDARTALTVAFDLLRGGTWSVGMGVGSVQQPLPATTREASGSAFVAARRAVTEAKRSAHRFSVAAEPAGAAPAVDAPGLAALIDLLLEVRDRRSAEGWEVADRLADGATQAAVAVELGITPQAVSLRARAAGVRVEQRAFPVLVDLLTGLDVGASV
jgi:hypothetical protein